MQCAVIAQLPFAEELFPVYIRSNMAAFNLKINCHLSFILIINTFYRTKPDTTVKLIDPIISLEITKLSKIVCLLRKIFLIATYSSWS